MNPNEKEKLKERLFDSRFIKNSEDVKMYKKAFDSLDDSVFDRKRTDLKVRFDIVDMSIDNAIKVLQDLQKDGCKTIGVGSDGYDYDDAYLYVLKENQIEPDDVFEDRIWDCVLDKSHELRNKCFKKKEEEINKLNKQMKELMNKDASEFLGYEETPELPF